MYNASLMHRGRLALALLCIAASCNPPSTARSAAGPPAPAYDEPTTPATPVAAVSSSPGTPSDVPADGHALAPDAAPVLAPVDVRTADGVLEFVRRMCEQASAGNTGWVHAHIALPLAGNVLVDENGVTRCSALTRVPTRRRWPASGSVAIHPRGGSRA